MAKGGGKAKGRPRKIVEVLSQATGGSTQREIGETSGIAASEINETITTVLEKIELEFSSAVATQQEELLASGAKEAKAQKIEDKDAPLLHNRGMNLGYVAPLLKDGKPTAKLSVSEIEKESAKWKNAIILYVIGEEPTIAYLKVFLKKQCGILGEFVIYYHNEGYFLVRFEKNSDKDRMMYEGPYMLANRPIIIKNWVADFCLEKDVLSEVPLWV